MKVRIGVLPNVEYWLGRFCLELSLSGEEDRNNNGACSMYLFHEQEQEETAGFGQIAKKRREFEDFWYALVLHDTFSFH
jgi:hypothetical protein